METQQLTTTTIVTEENKTSGDYLDAEKPLEIISTDIGLRINKYGTLPISICTTCGHYKPQWLGTTRCKGKCTCLPVNFLVKDYMRLAPNKIRQCPICMRLFPNWSNQIRTCESPICLDQEMKSKFYSGPKCVVCHQPCATQCTISTGIDSHLYGSRSSVVVGGTQYVCKGTCENWIKQWGSKQLKQNILELNGDDRSLFHL